MSARDPYVGLNRFIDQRAEGTQRPWYAIGRVLSLSPLRIRADGMDLDREDLRVPESLLPNFGEAAEHGVRSRLPKAYFECYVCDQMGYAIRPEEYVYGAAKIEIGSEVLLLRSGDAQTYYLIERMVTL